MAHERSPSIVAITDGRLVDVGSPTSSWRPRDSATTSACAGPEVAQRPPAVVAGQHEAHRGVPGAV